MLPMKRPGMSMGMPTPQNKLIQVADKFGLNQLKNQQGSTVVLYDTLPLDGITNLRFFENASQRNFPFSNMGPDGNKLGVGSGMVFERAYFSVCKLDTSGAYFSTFETIGEAVAGGVTVAPAVRNGEITINIANSDVLKKLPVLSFLPEYNHWSQNPLLETYNFDTLITLQQLLEFVVTLRLPNYTPDRENAYYLRLTIEGAGAIIAPRTTF